MWVFSRWIAGNEGSRSGVLWIYAPRAVEMVGRKERGPGKVGWRKGEVKWEDGGVAGGLMGLVVGTAYKLPRPLFIRSLVMGIVLGSLTSGMQTVQARIGRMREEEERKAKLTDNQQLSSPAAEAAATSALVTEEVAPVMSLSEETKPTEEIVVGGVPGEEEPRGWWESVKSWVGA